MARIVPKGGKCSKALVSGKRDLVKAIDAALTLDVCKRTSYGANSCAKELDNYRYSEGFKYAATHKIEEACGQFDDRFEDLWFAVMRAIEKVIETNRKGELPKR
jgi:hypothetical protein